MNMKISPRRHRGSDRGEPVEGHIEAELESPALERMGALKRPLGLEAGSPEEIAGPRAQESVGHMQGSDLCMAPLPR